MRRQGRRQPKAQVLAAEGAGLAELGCGAPVTQEKAREAGVGRNRARKALDDLRRNGSRRQDGGEAPRP